MNAVKKAVEELGIQAEVVKVEDLQDIINRGVMMTPAVVVDGEVKIVGHQPTLEEIKKINIQEGDFLFITLTGDTTIQELFDCIKALVKTPLAGKCLVAIKGRADVEEIKAINIETAKNILEGKDGKSSNCV